MYHDYLHQCCPAKPPGVFTKFKSLPPEIRLMIYEYALPDACVYEVLDAPNAKHKTPAQEGLMFANMHPAPPPALAAVCGESRHFVLRRYKPLRLGRTTKYVDMSRDMLLLEPYLLVKRLLRTLHFLSQIPLIADNINNLALGTSYGLFTGICHPILSWKVSKNNMVKLVLALAKFKRLESLILVVHQEFQFEFDYRLPAGGYGGVGGPMYHHPLAMPPAFSAGMGSAYLPAPGFEAGYRPTLLPPAHACPPFAPPLPYMLPPAPLHPQHHPLLVFPHPTYATQPLQLPQLVHQAFRFKFDIEANINHTPRRPHFNELLYYPLAVNEPKEDVEQADGDGDSDAGTWDHFGGAGPGDEEWLDPWPTNEDWRRFRRRFQRAVNAALESEFKCRRSGGRCGPGGATVGSKSGKSGKNGGHGTVGKGQRLRAPELKGASLLWRYTRGMSV